MSQTEVLVVIGQIGAGKSSVCRELASATRAEHIAIEDHKHPDGARLGAHELSRRIASAAARGAVVFECSGASRDFEDVIEHLRLRGLGCFVALIDCSIETALRRVRESKMRTRPRSGASWAAQLRWTESRLRLVPADVTISSENSHPATIAKAVEKAWSEAQSNPPAKSVACRELSFTQLAAFAVCPWSYRLKYVDRLQEAVETEQMHLGSRLHEALAYLYGRPDRDKAGLASWFRNRLTETLPDGVERPVVDRMLQTGLKALAYHYDVVYREERSNTLAVEQSVRLPLSAEQTFVGRVDRVARDASGTVEVIDYKVSEPRRTSRPRVPDWLQIAAYSAAVPAGTRPEIGDCAPNHADHRQRGALRGDGGRRASGVSLSTPVGQCANATAPHAKAHWEALRVLPVQHEVLRRFSVSTKTKRVGFSGVRRDGWPARPSSTDAPYAAVRCRLGTARHRSGSGCIRVDHTAANPTSLRTDYVCRAGSASARTRVDRVPDIALSRHPVRWQSGERRECTESRWTCSSSQKVDKQ